MRSPRLQMMFGPRSITAVQDPSYPVYVDTAVMMGQTGDIEPVTKQVDDYSVNDKNSLLP